MSSDALTVSGLSFAYPDGTVALQAVRFAVRPGEAVAIVGANGAGKSTLLRHLAGLTPSPQVQLAGVSTSHLPPAQLPRCVGYLFQDADDQLFMPTVFDDVAFGPRQLGLDDREAQARAWAALDAVSARALAPRSPYRLSGGEKRAAALAGVLAMSPPVLVMDEPTAGLDPVARRRLIGVLAALPLTRVVATHDLDLVLDLCSRVLVLHHGVLEADGAPADVFADDARLARCHLEPPLTWQGARRAAADWAVQKKCSSPAPTAVRSAPAAVATAGSTL